MWYNGQILFSPTVNGLVVYLGMYEIKRKKDRETLGIKNSLAVLFSKLDYYKEVKKLEFSELLANIECVDLRTINGKSIITTKEEDFLKQIQSDKYYFQEWQWCYCENNYLNTARAEGRKITDEVLREAGKSCTHIEGRKVGKFYWVTYENGEFKVTEDVEKSGVNYIDTNLDYMDYDEE